MNEAGREHPFARGRHLFIALAASLAYVAINLWFIDASGVVRVLAWVGGDEPVWTSEAATLGVAAQLVVVAIAAWFALVAYDTHSAVTLWPTSWKSLDDGYTLWLVAAEFVWTASTIGSMDETTRIGIAEGNYRMMFGREGLDWTWYLAFMTTGALAEEVLLRVLLQRAFEGYMSKYAAVFVQAALWLLMHAYLYGYGLTIPHAVSGVVLGLVFMRTRSLMAPLLVHWLMNVTLAALLVRGIGP